MNKRNVKRPNTYALSIWPTDGCNGYGVCKYCFYQDSDLWDISKANMMSPKVADATIDFINSGKVEMVSFFGGEPTLNMPIVKRILAGSHLPYLMKDLKPKGSSVYNITTNGTLLSKDVIDFLQLYRVHINLSLDGTKETQNYWRGGYDDIVRNLPDLLAYRPPVHILKTLGDPTTVYEDVKHIKELGFRSVFINLLDPFSLYTYEGYDVDEFKEQYKRVVSLDCETFKVSDYHKWKQLIRPETRKGIGCGFSNRGLCVDWEGNLWPCHQGPSLPKEFIIGDIWEGIDLEKERKVRSVPNSSLCSGCTYKLTPCWVSMYNKHGRFGMDPPKWHRDFEIAKIEVIEELEGYDGFTKACQIVPSRLLVGTLISEDKMYTLKSFFESLMNLQLPMPTDYVIVIDDTAKRLNHTLRVSLEGRSIHLPNLNTHFASVRAVKIPTKPSDGYMDKITRGRNLILSLARHPMYIGMVFIDADLLVTEDTLIQLLSVDADIVGALVRCRRDDQEGWFNNYRHVGGTVFERVQNFVPDEHLEVDATGCDCVLVRREVLTRHIYEWKPELPEAEDMGFCMKARKDGYRVKIHTGVSTRHLGIRDMEIKEVK